ncbi:protein-(glutamine-N5) methyltransferase, release factor-specific [Pollutimonas subterranea]|uniref:Release factor glutamine methyltransferase n=1 Tax=Pollutimonas subterranea TaxID=2045210 RepID=A0A2N4U685_9BURK|nr:peptide chain release factor N(5)-glutamine methyltransferase [Pollutimonas subterranea]PLC50509.1 protein-(glutamine-N5) methyltransferase, release factor-specific [Pollutimonas subterranea]
MACLRTMSRDSTLPRLEMQMLWQHVLQVPRSWLIAHDTDPLEPGAIIRFRELEARRMAGEPMAYIVGCREFMGHDFQVSPAVLIPRPETELLVETGLDYLKGKQSPLVLDLGTGSGAVAISIALRCPAATVVATDLSGDALAVARTNGRRLGAKVDFFQGSWYDALPGRKGFDLIVSNPPYIAAADSHLKEGDVRFEPAAALTDGSDGLSALRVIIEGAGRRLLSHGALFVEHGWDQAQAVRQLLQSTGFGQVASAPDLAGIDRVTGGIYN